MTRAQLFGSVAALAIMAGVGWSAKAADLPAPVYASQPVPEAAFSWAGFYLGGHLGYGEADFKTLPHEGETDDGTAKNDPSGIVGGMHLGYNWQANAFVFGLEADASATGWSDHDLFSDNSERGIDLDVDLLASLRARLGLAFDRTHVFVTGGLAYTQGEFLAHSPGGTVHSGGFEDIGAVLGLGVEQMMTQNFSARVEGFYYFFDNTEEFGSTGEEPWESDLNEAWVIRIGGTHHF